MKLIAVSAGLSTPSSTRLLADRLTESARQELTARGHLVSTEVIELRGLAGDVANHLVTGFPPPRLAAAIDAVTGADGLVVVTPVFAASYSGLFKSFFDVIDPDALTGQPVLVAATGGTARHSLVLEHAMRPLFAHLRAVVVPTAVYAASEDWGSGETSTPTACPPASGGRAASWPRSWPPARPGPNPRTTSAPSNGSSRTCASTDAGTVPHTVPPYRTRDRVPFRAALPGGMSVNRLTTWPLPEDFDGRGAPVRGREAELAFVEARLDALAGGEGGVVLVEGPAGIGKSRILREASASAKRRGMRVFQGGADPAEQFVPLGPLLEGLLSGAEPLSDAARLRDLATRPGQRFWLLQELGERLREAARGGPLLIVLDDLQWCDDLTLLTFHTVAAGLSSHAILWLVAVRGASVPPAVRTTLDRIRQGGAHEVALGPLGDRAIAHLAEDVLGAVPGPDVLGVARRAEGVPLLVVELLGALREEGVVTIENGTARLSPGSLPARPLPSVARRLDLLSEASRELVETVAAVGRPVTVGQLGELLGRSPAALITAVRESLDADLLTERGEHLEFRNELIREAVEAGLPLSLRRTLRGHTAEVLPKSAETPADGTELADRAAVDRLRTAAAELAATAPASAAELSLRALELSTADDPRRPGVVAETIPLLWQTGQSARARHLGVSALSAGVPGPEDEARIRLGLARLGAQFDFSEAVRQARAGAALPGIPAALRARLLALLCLGLSLSGHDEAAGQAVAGALEAVEAAGDRAAEATLLVAESAVRFRRMDWSEAFRRADRAGALAEGLGIAPSPWVPEALWQGFLLNAAGRPAEALAVADAGVRDSRNQGRAAATRMWLMNRARALLDAGRLTDALADAETASAMTDELGTGNLADLTLLYARVRIALHTNDQEAARGCASQVRRMRSDSAPLVRDAGAWLLALLADFEAGPTAPWPNSATPWTGLASWSTPSTPPSSSGWRCGPVHPSGPRRRSKRPSGGPRSTRTSRSWPPPPRTPEACSTTTSATSCARSGSTGNALGRSPGPLRWRTRGASSRLPVRPKRCPTWTRPSLSTHGRERSGTWPACVGACGPWACADSPRRPDTSRNGPS